MITKVINKRWMAVCLSLVIFMTTVQFEGTIQVNGVNEETTDSVLIANITVKNADGREPVIENDTYYVNSENPIIEVSNAENIKEIGYSIQDDSTEEIITPVEPNDDGSYSLPKLNSGILYKIWITNNQDEIFKSICIVYDNNDPIFMSIDEKEITSDEDIADVYWTNENFVVIKASDGKNGSGVVLKYSNEPDYATADNTITDEEGNDEYVLKELTEGETYYVWLCDKVGNYIKNPIQIKYDCTAPQVEKITDINNNNLFEKTEEDEKIIYWTNQNTVKIYLKNSEKETINFENSNIDSANLLEDESDDNVICYEVKLGSDNNYICVSDEAGNITEIFVNKKLSIDYAVRTDEKYLIPNGEEGILYTIHADILIIDVTGENMAGVGIESVEECIYDEKNLEDNNYIKVEETDSNYNIKLDKENIIQVKITDKLGNISIIQLEYKDNDASLVFYDDENNVSIFPDEENTYYLNNYYSFSLFNYSKKITEIHYSIFGNEQSTITPEIEQIENIKFSLKEVVEGLKQDEKKFYELCFQIDTRGYKNEEKTEKYKIVYDSEAPEFTIKNNVENKYVNGNTKEYIELNDVEDNSGILKAEYFISDDKNENPEKYEFIPSSDGKYKLEIRELSNKLKAGDNEINFILTDKAGNEKLKSTIIKYDDTAPAFTAQYSHNGETIGKITDYVIEIKARDDMSKVGAIKCIINEGDSIKKKERIYSLEDNDENEINYTISINDILDDLAEGSNTVRIVVIDKAGNENNKMDGTNIEVYTIVKDTTAPEFEIQYQKDGKPFGKNTVDPILLKGIKDASDIKRITFIINKGKGQSVEKSVDYVYIENNEYKFIPSEHMDDFLEGKNTVTIEVEDAVGNIGSKSFDSVIRDTKEPVFETSYSGEGKPNGKDTIEKIDIKNIVDESKVTGITCIINKGKKTEKIFEPSYNGKENYTINISEIMDDLSEGENTVQIEVTDEVDNIGRSVIYNVKKDTTPPQFISDFENNDKEFITKTTSAKITVKDISDKSEVKTITFIIKKGNTDGVNNGEVKYQYLYEKDKEYILDLQKNLKDLSEGSNTIRIEVSDEVGNIGEIEYTVIKDTKAPNITLTYNNNGYITNGTEAKVVIKNISDDVSGVESITYYINGHIIEEKYSKNKDYSISLGDYLNKLSGGENEIRVIVKDKAGNESSRDCTVKKDTEPPNAEFEYKYDNININSDYNAQIIIRKVHDELSEIKNVTYSVGSHEETLTPKNGIYTLNINDLLLSREAILQQRKNKITITISDNAGNSIVKDFNICIDTIKPEVGIPKFDETVKVEHEGNNYYIKEATTLFVPVSDEVELKSVVLIMGDKEEICNVSGQSALAEFKLPAGFKGKLSVYAVDRVGNMSERRDVGGTFIETAEMHDTYSAITFSKPETAFRDTAGNELYREERIPVTIDVTDNFSGIKQIEWKVSSADTEAAASENGYIIINGTELSGNLEQVNISNNNKYNEEKIITHLSKELFISDNSNNITITVTLTDNAGNTSHKEIVFSNDTTSPVVTVTYDNNTPDAGNGQMFNRERTATIEVAERNFDPDRMIIDITNTDNIVPNITGWTIEPGTGNQDDTVYTTTITYSADGDYVFNMSFQDMAGHNAQINFGNSVAPQTFTVDRTKPVLNVTYDNSDGNGVYFKDSRTATITIDEHNFSEDRLNLTVIKNGSNETPQSIGWSNNGDTHSLTLIFAEEAEYSIMVSYTDMAGNMADNTVNNSFFVDKSEPQVLLSGIENQKAYKSGQIGFEISGTDIYFDTLNVSLIRIDNFGNRTTINLNKTAIENGEKVSVDNLTQDGIYQLSYTATDKSARNVGETIIFSVNRNGSTYMLSDEVMKLNKSYVKSVDYDIVIKEVNVNELLMDSVVLTLSRGSSSKELKEGVDFTVQKNTGSEQWCEYVYIIKKSCFTEDGLYSLSISSKDISGNLSVSDLEAKASELSFVVDKTSPICNVMNLKSGTTYATNSKHVEFTVSDNIMLSKVSVLLNGTELLNLTEETLRQIADNGENISFDIPNSDSAQTVVIQYADKAGNEGITEIKDFYVTTNPWIRYTNNTPLMVSTLAGAVAVLGLAAFVLMFRKKAGR